MLYFVSLGYDNKKVVTPVLSAEDYKKLRNSETNKNNVRLAREGDNDAKRRLVQFTYNGLHPDGKLAGESYLNQFFAFDYDDPETREAFIEKVDHNREELGAVMLERSVHGAHAIFLRRKGESIEEGCQRISQMTGFPYDKNCKDLNRVIFATTASREDLIFCYDCLFTKDIDWDEAKRETEEILRRPFKPVQHLLEDKSSQKAPETLDNQGTLGAQGETAELTPQQREIIEGAFRICGYEPDEITEGVRNNAIFSVAMKLRHWAGFKEEKILPLLYPHYSFGLPEDEVRGAVRSALKEERGYAPKELMALIKKVEGGNTDDNADANAANYDPIAEAYRPFAEAVVEELNMPALPKLMKVLLKAAPYGYKFPVMAAICPAACTLLTDVKMKYGTKSPKRMNAWTHLDGQFSASKGLMRQPIETLLYELKQQDIANEAIMNAVKERNRLNRNKESLEKVPELPIRIVGAGTTRKQHIIMMKNAAGRHTFTLTEELDSLKSRGSSYYDREDFERYMFDNGMVSVNTAVDDSPNLTVKVMWNMATSGTRDQMVKHWRCATNGAISRIWFVIMSDTVFAPLPEYYQYTDEEKAYISRASLIMMKLHGLLLTPKLDKAMLKWNTDVRIACEAVNNRARAQLKNRAQEIAHTFGGVLHCMDIVQQIMDREDQGFDSEEERKEWESHAYDFSQYKEIPRNIKMALYCADSILDTQESLWGHQIVEQTLSAIAHQKPVVKVNNDLQLLPKGEFTVNDLVPLFPNRKYDSLKVMCSRYCQTGLIHRIGTRDRKTVYQKAS